MGGGQKRKWDGGGKGGKGGKGKGGKGKGKKGGKDGGKGGKGGKGGGKRPAATCQEGPNKEMYNGRVP